MERVTTSQNVPGEREPGTNTLVSFSSFPPHFLPVPRLLTPGDAEGKGAVDLWMWPSSKTQSRAEQRPGEAPKQEQVCKIEGGQVLEGCPQGAESRAPQCILEGSLWPLQRQM